MRKRNFAGEILFLAILVAFSAMWARLKVTDGPVPSTPAPTAPSPEFRPWAAPAFQLESLNAGLVSYPGGTGPMFINLSLVGCPDCLRRVDTFDRQAYQLARKAGWPVWTILVGVDRARGRDYLARMSPDSDLILFDPDTSVAVGKYRGSDATCWILVDRRGAIIWQGAPGESGLQELASRLRGAGAETTR